MSGSASGWQSLGRISRAEIDCERSLSCGQTFSWARLHDGSWIGVVGTAAYRITPEKEDYAIESLRGSRQALLDYFASSVDWTRVAHALPSDPVLASAWVAGQGIRILAQDPWEALASFLCSPVKPIPEIRRITWMLRAEWGRPIAGSRLCTFPAPEALASAPGEALLARRLGFRARSLQAVARLLAEDPDFFPRLGTQSTGEARAHLCELPGVGRKIADCVLLFGLGRYDAFPIDIWMERLLRKLYFAHRKEVSARRIAEFAAAHFGPYGGYAQQLLYFWYRRSAGRNPARELALSPEEEAQLGL
ncbi:DNA-3-methyladenine glycosylase [Methylacidimicrobium sp. B4]|uniref:DNA-3-methyladenine glycosylase family protein n=1 Tax=Methylacidimicrobium sp. B4 TaxID=2796139 RepID=UPI001A8EC984|nr:DNA glycosylase [Methylacidimicrobium sp. B4]QSR84633.1 3-methyladenine DNA glycosylase [Methylacidimicrobium sp. B4]